jgi:hypothetical protein
MPDLFIFLLQLSSNTEVKKKRLPYATKAECNSLPLSQPGGSRRRQYWKKKHAISLWTLRKCPNPLL